MPTVMIGAALGVCASSAVPISLATCCFLHPRRRRACDYLRRNRGRRARFLWFNAYPAGLHGRRRGTRARRRARNDCGDHAQEIVLFIMGGVFVVETISVMLQVTYFKSSRGRRIFRMAPLHHHFELSGWKRDAGRRAVLDHHDDVGAGGPVDSENSMRTLRFDDRRLTRLVLGLGA